MTAGEATFRELGRRIACERPLVKHSERVHVAQIDSAVLKAAVIRRQVNSTQ